MIVGMTDEAPKPKRKRWRWIIAGFLFFVVVTIWWYWPRGDARVVGKWSVASDHGIYEEWTFDANGLMHSRDV
jgi:hypothetical protein